MSTQIYCNSDDKNTIIEKSIEFINAIFSDNPDIETVFMPTTKDFEVMISIEEGKITGYWNSEDGSEDYAEIRSFLEIHQLKQDQEVKDIVESGY